MSEAEATPEQSNPKPPNIWPMFAGGLVLLVLFAGLVLWLMGRTERGESEDARRSAQREEFLAQAKQEAAVLQEYAWANQEEGRVRIPLTRAVELTLAELANSEPKPAYPITQSPPSPPADAIGIPASLRKFTPAVTAPAPGDGEAAPADGEAPAPAEAAAEPSEAPEGGNN